MGIFQEFHNMIRLSIEGDVYRNYTISELLRLLEKNPIIEAVENGAFSKVGRTIEDVINRPCFENETFESIYHISYIQKDSRRINNE